MRQGVLDPPRALPVRPGGVKGLGDGASQICGISESWDRCLLELRPWDSHPHRNQLNRVESVYFPLV